MPNDLQHEVTSLELVLTDYVGSAYSPQVEVEDIEGGHNVSITHKGPDGIVTDSFDVMDGVSPTVDITSTTQRHTITITDAQGPHVYEVDTYADDELARVTAENGRVSAESSRVSAESARADAETGRSTAESARDEAESARSAAEATRAENEGTRVANETARVNAESTRNEAEQAREQAETSREAAWDALSTQATAATQAANNAAQEASQAASNAADAAQSASQAESTMTANETARASAEQGRVAAEQSRVTAEQARVSAETARAETWADLVDEIEDATDAAELAATAVKPEVDRLLGNILIGELAEAAVLTTDDAYTAPPESVNVYGKSTQDGTPTPDAPVEIKSVDDLTLNVCGKNLFNPSHLLEASDWTVSDGVYTGMSNALYNKYKLDSGGYPIGGLSGTAQSYVMSLDYTPSDATKNTYIQFMYDDGTIDQYAIILKAAGHYTGTSNPNKALAVIGFLYSSTQSISLSNIQLEVGTTATAYEPYVGTTISIPLSDHIARSLPDGTRDTLTLSYQGLSTREGWGVFGVTLRQVADTLDLGTLTWTKLGEKTVYHAYVANAVGTADPAKAANIMCTNYIPANYSTAVNNDGYIALAENTHRVYIFDSDYTDAASFKQAVSGAILQFQLATPITHDLGTVELPILPNPLTAWADGGSAQTTMQLEYERALSIVIPRIEEAISDLATS